MTWELIFALLGAVGGLAGIITAVSSRAKLRAEAEKIEVEASNLLSSTAMDSATRMIQRLDGQVKSLSDNMETLRTELGSLRIREATLTYRIQILEQFILSKGFELPVTGKLPHV